MRPDNNGYETTLWSRHWKPRVAMTSTWLSLVAPEDVITTIPHATSEDKIGDKTIRGFSLSEFFSPLSPGAACHDNNMLPWLNVESKQYLTIVPHTDYITNYKFLMISMALWQMIHWPQLADQIVMLSNLNTTSYVLLKRQQNIFLNTYSLRNTIFTRLKCVNVGLLRDLELTEADWRICTSVNGPILVQVMACRRKAMISTNVGILSIGHLRTNFSEISIKIHIFSFMKMLLKMSSANVDHIVSNLMCW